MRHSRGILLAAAMSSTVVLLTSCSMPNLGELFTGESASPSPEISTNGTSTDGAEPSGNSSRPPVPMLEGAYTVEYRQQVGDKETAAAGYVAFTEKGCAENLTVTYLPSAPGVEVRKAVTGNEYQQVPATEDTESTEMWTDSRNLAGDTPFLLPTANLIHGEKSQQGLCSLVSLPDVLFPDETGYRWDTRAFNLYAENGLQTWAMTALKKAGVPKETIRTIVPMMLNADEADYSLSLQQMSPVTVTQTSDVITYMMGDEANAVWVKIVLTPTSLMKVSIPEDVVEFPDFSETMILEKLLSFEGLDSDLLSGYGLESLGEGTSILPSSSPEEESYEFDLSELNDLVPSEVPEFDNNLLTPTPTPSVPPSAPPTDTPTPVPSPTLTP